MSSFARKICLFCLVLIPGLISAYSFSNATALWSLPLPSKEHQKEALKEFEREAAPIMGKNTAHQLIEEIDGDMWRGTCFGQSLTFMILNPPHVEEIQFPQTTEDYKKIIWLQSYSDAGFFAFRKQQAVREKAVAIVRKAYPSLAWSDEKILKNLASLLQKMEKTGQYTKQLTALQKGFTKIGNFVKLLKELDSKADEQLAGFKVHESIFEQVEAGKLKALEKTFQKKFIKMIADPSITDALVVFDLEWEGEQSGHAIMVQIKHKRIYDAMAGVFQYDNLSDLYEDIPIGEHKGSTYFQILPFSPVENGAP